MSLRIPVLRYPFNESVSEDVSPNAHQSQAYEGVTLVDDPTMGTVAEFDGTSASYMVGPTLPVSTRRAASYWIYVHTWDYAFIYGIGAYHFSYWGGRVDNASRMLIRVGFGVNSTHMYTSELELGKWYHICDMYDGKTVWRYINGELTDSDTTAGPKLDPNDLFYVGVNAKFKNSNNYHFHGRLSDLRVYNSTLYLEEINSLYLLGPNSEPEIPGTIQMKWAGSTSLSLEVEGDPNVDYRVVVADQVVDNVKSGDTVNIHDLESNATYDCDLFKSG